MCFSAEASFSVGAALIACSGLTLHLARPLGARFLPLASFPLFFGIQQVSEGVVWLSLGEPPGPALGPAAMAFLFFAYWFWPTWVPWSSALIEAHAGRRRFFLGVSAFGFAFGLALYLPVLLLPDALDVHLVGHSLHYGNPHLFPEEVSALAARMTYTAVIAIPLLGSSHRQVRAFGYLVLASVVIGFAVASHAFTSVWCFLAAMLSAYIVVVLRAERAAAPGATTPGNG